jgi:acyl-CoA synthetase (AMP-forming)/AMP-acid ligase II
LNPTESLLAHIEARSATDPSAALIIEADGDTYSYADAARLVHGWIEWFAAERAVRPLRVGAILPNAAVTHLLRLAAANAGVVFTSLNPMLSGKSLMDALARSQITDVVLPRRMDGRLVDANGVLCGRRSDFAVHWCEREQVDFEAVAADPQAVPGPAARDAVPHPRLHLRHVRSGQAGTAAR